MMMTGKSEPTGLRILQVLEPGGGGSGRHFLDLCRGLSRRGHHVHAVYSPVRAEDAFVRDLFASNLSAVTSVPMIRAPGLSDVQAYRMLTDLISSEGPFDIIHGHSSKAGALTRLRVPGKHVPRIYTPHAFRTMDPALGRGGRLIYGGIERVLAQFFSDAIVCVSQDEYDHARSIGIPASRLSIIINGVATPPTDTRATVRQQAGIPHAALVFGFVGRLSWQKAPERIINAFCAMAPSVPSAHLLMVGSGELHADVRARIARSGYANRIHLTSAITGANAMDAIDALVMASRYEAMSYVMLEAAAAGKPILTTDVGGASTVLMDRFNGFMVPNADNPQPLADAMLEFSNADTRRLLVAGARAHMEGYSLDAMVTATESLYLKLSERPLKAPYLQRRQMTPPRLDETGPALEVFRKVDH